MLRFFLKIVMFLLCSLLALIAVFFIGVFWPLDEIMPANTNSPIVIKNISTIDFYSGETLRNQTVIIKNKKITSVGSSQTITLPENAYEIDGQDRYVIPSLWDMHTHIFKISPLLDLPLYITYGVTNVRDMTSCPKKGDPFISCPEDLKRWTELAESSELVGPRVQGIISWQVNGPGVLKKIKGLPDFFGTATPKQAREFVRYYSERHSGKVDAIKVYNYIPRDAYFALVDEAKKVGLDVIGHRPHAISAIEAAENQKSIEHARFILHESYIGSEELRESASIKGAWKEDRRRMLDEHDTDMANDIFDAMKANGTWYIPTHLTRQVDAYADDERILNDANLRFLHPLMKWQWKEDVDKVINRNPSPEARKTYRDFYEKGLELTGAAHKAGVKILLGTDYIVAGATVHDELQQLVLAGLSPLDALRAATVLPAEYFGLQNEYGRIDVGFKADLIILNKNPLDDINQSKAIESVIFNGNLYDRTRLDKIEEQVETRAKSWTLGCKILWAFLKNPVDY